jgi:hypothetical protein
MKSSSRPVLVAVFAIALLSLTLSAPAAWAQKRTRTVGLESWRGQRVLLLLPLQLGEAFNVDRAFGEALLPDAEQSLQAMLQKTGKFSVMEAHRFNPVLQRALVEKAITNDQLTNLIKTPSLENARTVLSKISFDRPPLIAQFIVEELRLGGTAKNTSVQAQVSGRLYELGNPVAIKSTVITSGSQSGGSVTSSTLAAMNDSFRRSVVEFVAPIEEIQLVLPEPSAPVKAPVPVAPAPVALPEPVVVPAPPRGDVSLLTGGTPMAGASSRGPIGNGVPQLPSATPPLGINVPNVPTAER